MYSKLKSRKIQISETEGVTTSPQNNTLIYPGRRVDGFTGRRWLRCCGYRNQIILARHYPLSKCNANLAQEKGYRSLKDSSITAVHNANFSMEKRSAGLFSDFGSATFPMLHCTANLAREKGRGEPQGLKHPTAICNENFNMGKRRAGLFSDFGSATFRCHMPGKYSMGLLEWLRCSVLL